MYLVYHAWKKLKQEVYNEGFELFIVVQVEILGYNKYWYEKLTQCLGAVKKINKTARIIMKRDSKIWMHR